MDPETISPIAINNPECKFVVPAAEVEEAIARNMNKQKIIPINAHQRIKLDDMISISAIPAAHESLKLNSRGEDHFLGYILHFNKYNIYHSGDCVPYNELEKYLKLYNINAALLPINGRDEYRLKNGIAGNFQVYEALNLCIHLKIKYLMVHHFGMFAYNTIKDEILNDISKSSSQSLQIIVPKINVIYQFYMGT
jgi:L-ascorbate metabolism protein UlaG (beta-lactamase superfamily)